MGAEVPFYRAVLVSACSSPPAGSHAQPLMRFAMLEGGVTDPRDMCVLFDVHGHAVVSLTFLVSLV